MAEISVRNAASCDAEAVAALANMLAVAVGTRAEGDAPMTAEHVRADLIDAPGLNLVVAERGGEVLGYALYTVAYETAYASRGVYVSDLAVAEEARRQGVARALMRTVAAAAIADGGRYVWWVVAPENAPAKAFYDGLGGVSYPVEARAIFDAPFEALIATDSG
ncbi:MAG: GNAT family N-acetyltransferase [Pseudomonadota bacterium]